MKAKVLVTTSRAKESFRSVSRLAEIYRLDELKEEELDPLLPAVDCIFTLFWPRSLDAVKLSRMKRLRFVQCELAGVNDIPFRHLSESVTVCSNAGAYSVEVGEYSWALLLAAAKRIVAYNSAVRTEDFRRPPSAQLGREVTVLKGGTLGVVGYGGIGRVVETFGEAFGMRVYALTRRRQRGGDVESFRGEAGLLRLLHASDACILALPLSKLTKGMIGTKQLSVMKSDGILVNVGRAEVVDERALYDHLSGNPRFTYATDVWWSRDGAESFSPHLPFLKLENFIGTPHASGPSAYVTGGPPRYAIANLLRYLNGETPENIVDRSEYV